MLPESFLTPFHKRVLVGALTCLSVFVIVAFLVFVFWLAGKFLTVFSGAIWPLAVALILSFLLQPMCEFFEKKFRISRASAITLLYVLVVAACAVIAFIILPTAIGQLTDLIKKFPQIYQNAEIQFTENLQPLLQRIGVIDVASAEKGVDNIAPLREFSEKLLEWLKSLDMFSGTKIAGIGAKLGALFGYASGAAIVPVYLAYMLDLRRDFLGDMRRESGFLPKNLHQDLTFLVEQFVGILVSFFRGQLLIGVILGILMAIGFTCAGLKFGLLIGLFAGLLNIVPYLGSVIGLAVALPLAYFQPDGGIWTLVWVGGIFALVQLIDGYFISPRIMGKSTGLHPMAVVFSIFFWGSALDGFLGMLLAVPLSAFFVVFWRLLREKYLPRWLRVKDAE